MLLLPSLLAARALAAPEMIPVEAFEAAKGSGQEITDFELPLRDGGSFVLSKQRGKTVVLSFWASWCTPCRKELPALSEFAKGHPELTVIAVNVDRKREDAEKFLKSVSIGLPVAYDPDAKALGKYGVTSMPTMFLIDKAGKFAWRKTGFSEERGLSELQAQVETLK